MAKDDDDGPSDASADFDDAYLMSKGHAPLDFDSSKRQNSGDSRTSNFSVSAAEARM